MVRAKAARSTELSRALDGKELAIHQLHRGTGERSVVHIEEAQRETPLDKVIAACYEKETAHTSALTDETIAWHLLPLLSTRARRVGCRLSKPPSALNRPRGAHHSTAVDHAP